MLLPIRVTLNLSFLSSLLLKFSFIKNEIMFCASQKYFKYKKKIIPANQLRQIIFPKLFYNEIMFCASQKYFKRESIDIYAWKLCWFIKIKFLNKQNLQLKSLDNLFFFLIFLIINQIRSTHTHTTQNS